MVRNSFVRRSEIRKHHKLQSWRVQPGSQFFTDSSFFAIDAKMNNIPSILNVSHSWHVIAPIRKSKWIYIHLEFTFCRFVFHNWILVDYLKWSYNYRTGIDYFYYYLILPSLRRKYSSTLLDTVLFSIPITSDMKLGEHQQLIYKIGSRNYSANKWI